MTLCALFFFNNVTTTRHRSFTHMHEVSRLCNHLFKPFTVNGEVIYFCQRNNLLAVLSFVRDW